MGPNFITFLGQKYGYRPIPTYIPSAELQLIRDDLDVSKFYININYIQIFYLIFRHRELMFHY